MFHRLVARGTIDMHAGAARSAYGYREVGPVILTLNIPILQLNSHWYYSPSDKFIKISTKEEPYKYTVDNVACRAKEIKDSLPKQSLRVISLHLTSKGKMLFAFTLPGFSSKSNSRATFNTLDSWTHHCRLARKYPNPSGMPMPLRGPLTQLS